MDSLDLQFRVATTEELEANNDHCAICWETMDTARLFSVLLGSFVFDSKTLLNSMYLISRTCYYKYHE